jgi:hypothetical protein
MRILLAAFSLVACSAWADSPKCAYMPCGNYEGRGSWYNADGKPEKDGQYNEKIQISQLDEHTVNIKVYIYRGDTAGKPWTDSNIVFDDRGQLNLVDEKGVSHAAGYCAHEVCTVSFRPVTAKEKDGKPFINAFVNILRFENGGLKRYNMVADSVIDSELKFQRSDLVKK